MDDMMESLFDQAKTYELSAVDGNMDKNACVLAAVTGLPEAECDAAIRGVKESIPVFKMNEAVKRLVPERTTEMYSYQSNPNVRRTEVQVAEWLEQHNTGEPTLIRIEGKWAALCGRGASVVRVDGCGYWTPRAFVPSPTERSQFVDCAVVVQ